MDNIIYLSLIIYAVLAAFAIILYFPRILGYRYGFKSVQHPRATANRRIGVVIPARGESKIIGDLLQSLESQDYDKNFFEIFVIVKDMDDPTVQIAAKRGISVTVIPDQKCKGDALNGFFNGNLSDKLASFDAFVIVDADGVLASDYLSELNRALEQDADIVVTRKLAKNFLGGKSSRSLFSNCAALIWPEVDELGNARRTRKGVPLNICGQGLMVRRRVIEEVGGWPNSSFTEDFELKVLSILNGFKSVYYPYAKIYTEEATGFKENFNRRVRWMAGVQQCNRLYAQNMREDVQQNTAHVRSGYFSDVVPYVLYLLSTILTVLWGAGLTVHFVAVHSPQWIWSLCLLVILPTAALYLLLFVFGIIALAASGGAFRVVTLHERIAMIFYNPFYLLGFLPAYVAGFVYIHKKGALVWRQTERVMRGNNE